jgi:hypothetical protein
MDATRNYYYYYYLLWRRWADVGADGRLGSQVSSVYTEC